MKVLIIGAGSTGSMIAKYLIDSGCRDILCGTKDIKTSKKFLNGYLDKIKLVFIDIEKLEKYNRYLNWADTIINSALPQYNIKIITQAARMKKNYLDLCSELDEMKSPEQLKFHNEFVKNKKIAIINVGSSPGISNILAAECAEELDTIESMKIKVWEHQKSGRPFIPWSPLLQLNDDKSYQYKFENKKYTGVKKWYDIEKNAEKQTIFYTFTNDELLTIPHKLEIPNLKVMVGGNDIEILKTLEEFKINQSSVKVPTPNEMETLKRQTFYEANFTVSVEVVGLKENSRICIQKTINFPDPKQYWLQYPGVNHIAHASGLSVAIFCLTLKQIDNFGVFAPEDLDKKIRKQILSKLINEKSYMKNEIYKKEEQKKFIQSKKFNFNYIIDKTSKSMELGHSKIHGQGVITTGVVKKDDIVCPLIGLLYDFRYAKIKYPKYSYQITDTLALEPINEPRCFNHSCNPNTYLGDDWFFYALRDIEPREEITIDYRTMDYSDYGFECLCGSPGCKGIFHGQDASNLEFQQKNKDLFSPYLKNKFFC